MVRGRPAPLFFDGPEELYVGFPMFSLFVGLWWLSLS